MSHFRFEGVDGQGRRRGGRLEAESRERALLLAGEKGLRILSLDAVKPEESIWKRDLFGSGGVKRGDVLSVVKDLSMLLGAELTVDRALRLGCRQAPRSVRPAMEAVLADVLAGQSLSRAFRRHPKIFPREVVEVVAAGEMTGTLGRVLADLSTSLGRAEEIRRTVVSALIYPALLLVMALGIVGLVIGVLVPSLEPLFDQPGVEKPAVIALIRTAEAVFAAHWPLILGAIFSVDDLATR